MHRDPREVKLTDEEARYLTEGDENTTTKPPTFAEWGHLFTHRDDVGDDRRLLRNRYTLWLYTGWLPFYLEHERHMSVAKVGVVAAIPYLFGCLGAVTGGWLCDLLTRRGLGADERAQGADVFIALRHICMYGRTVVFARIEHSGD